MIANDFSRKSSDITQGAFWGVALSSAALVLSGSCELSVVMATANVLFAKTDEKFFGHAGFLVGILLSIATALTSQSVQDFAATKAEVSLPARAYSGPAPVEPSSVYLAKRFYTPPAP